MKKIVSYFLILCLSLLIITPFMTEKAYADGTGSAYCKWIYSSTFSVTFTSGPLSGQTLTGACQYPGVPGWEGYHSYSYDTWESGNYRYHQVSIWDGSHGSYKYVLVSPDSWMPGQIDEAQYEQAKRWVRFGSQYRNYERAQTRLYNLRQAPYDGPQAAELLHANLLVKLQDLGFWMNPTTIETFVTTYFANDEGTIAYAQGIKISWEEELSGKLTLGKTSNRTDLHTVYPLTGAQYTAYTNSACTTIATDINGNNAVWTISSNGDGGTKTFKPGTYYIKETKAPTNNAYDMDATVYTVTISAGDEKTILSTDSSKPGKGKVNKSY